MASEIHSAFTYLTRHISDMVLCFTYLTRQIRKEKEISAPKAADAVRIAPAAK